MQAPSSSRSFASRHGFLVGSALIVAVLIVLSLIVVLGGGEDADASGGAGAKGGARATPVAIIRPVTHVFSEQIEALGVAKAIRGIELTSNTTEMVSRVLFSDGQSVQTGQVLIELQAGQEAAAVDGIEASLVLARATHRRWQGLVEQGIAPRSRADETRSAVDALEAQLTAAQAQQQDRVIRAPFSGVMGLSDVAPGSLITPGTVIASLDDLSRIRADIEVPDRYLTRLRPGMAVTATSEAMLGRFFAGTVQRLDSRIDEATRAVTVRIEFANSDRVLRPGMLLKVTLRSGSRSTLAVPQPAVQFEDDKAYVFVVVRKDGKATVQRRAVVAGTDQDGLIEVSSGLTASDEIVADGLNRVQDKMPVSPVTDRKAGPMAAPASGKS